MAEIPYRFERDRDAASLHAELAGLDPGAETGTVVSVAGRLMLRRAQGKLAFGTLQDSSGRIQLFATKDRTPDFDGFGALSLGDWIGVRGEVVKTRRGELSVMVDEWVLLAEARRPFPDKWHGLSDVDTRYRQRYVDLWVTEESRRVLRLRSRLVSLLRRFLEDRGFVEVETPVLHHVAGGAPARPFVTHHNALDLDLSLRVATELHLKRLVVGGFEKVFEVGRTFRNEGLSPRHNPEFTMLEVYEAYADYGDMMALTEDLVVHLATELHGTTKLSYGDRALDLTPPWRRATLAELVEEHAGLRVSVDMPVDELRAIASAHGVDAHDGWGPGKLVLEIYEKTTEHALWGPVFVCDYPREVSPLARAHRSTPGLVAGAGQRLQRAGRPRRPAGPLRGPGPPEGGRGRRDHGDRRGLRQGPGVRHAAHRRPRHRRRPPGHAPRRRPPHPRRPAVPDPATRGDRSWLAGRRSRRRPSRTRVSRRPPVAAGGGLPGWRQVEESGGG
jgi:lysyl-tRNA synthetase, class II